MANIASVLKEEIARLARKVLRGDTKSLKRASAQYRSDIASLKRRILALEKEVSSLAKRNAKNPVAVQKPESGVGIRFSSKGLAAKRKSLGLSAADVGLLLGVSGQTVYHWEAGKTRPREHQKPAIAALRSLGKREAKSRLQSMTS